MEEDIKKELSIINSSGFLLQLGLNRLIHQTRLNEEHNFDVLVNEHPWQNGNTNEEGFVDLILDSGMTKLVVECKRPLDGEWIFLVSENSSNNVSKDRGMWSLTSKENPGISMVDEFSVLPTSFQSSVCLLRGQGETKLSLLERLAGQLLKALESIVIEELSISKNKFSHGHTAYFPVIITTADLKVAKIKENEISMKNGKITDAEIISVPFIRFRKSLVNNLSPNSNPSDLRETNKNKERTVFVVNSENIVEFLKKFRVDSYGYYPWQRI